MAAAAEVLTCNVCLRSGLGTEAGSFVFKTGCEHLLCKDCAIKSFSGAAAPTCPICSTPTGNAVLQIPVLPTTSALDDAAWFYILTRPAMALKLLGASLRFQRSQTQWAQDKLRSMAKHARSQRRAVNQRAQDAEARLAELEQASAAASSTAAEVADRARCLARALHSTRDRGTALHDAIAGLDDIERLATSSLSSDARHPRPCSLSEQRAGHADDERGSGRRSQPTRTTPRGQSTPFYTSKRMRGVSHHDLARESSMHASGRSPSAATMPPHEAVPRSTPSASHTPHNTASRRHVLQSYPPEHLPESRSARSLARGAITGARARSQTPLPHGRTIANTDLTRVVAGSSGSSVAYRSMLPPRQRSVAATGRSGSISAERVASRSLPRSSLQTRPRRGVSASPAIRGDPLLLD